LKSFSIRVTKPSFLSCFKDLEIVASETPVPNSMYVSDARTLPSESGNLHACVLIHRKSRKESPESLRIAESQKIACDILKNPVSLGSSF
jgi:hypothetical protein